MDSLTKKIDEFLQDDNATPEQVKNVANECLKAEMTMDAAEIQDLANQINEATGKGNHNLYLISYMKYFQNL